MQMIEYKVKCINVIGELRVKIMANQVKEMNLRLNEMKTKVEFISERERLLILNPHLTSQVSIAPVVLYIGLILLKF